MVTGVMVRLPRTPTLSPTPQGPSGNYPWVGGLNRSLKTTTDARCPPLKTTTPSILSPSGWQGDKDRGI